MDSGKLHDMFEALDGNEYIKFDRIPVEQRRHRRPDVCAFIYLDEKQPGDGRDMVSASERDEFYLDVDISRIELTEEDVLYLSRCGVRYDSYNDCLCMFS